MHNLENKTPTIRVGIFALILSFLLPLRLEAGSAITSFDQAKRVVREVYDQRHDKTFYCSCDFEFNNRGTGGKVEPDKCGLTIPGWANRATRIEYEHVVAAHTIGGHLKCWEEGGRENCAKTNRNFQLAYSEPINLRIAVGSVNAARSNYPLTYLPAQPDITFGQCDMQIARGVAAQPPKEARGKVARVNFFMSDKYGIPLSLEQQIIYKDWHDAYPPSEEELRLNERFTATIGYGNPYVTNDQVWRVSLSNTSSSLELSGSLQMQSGRQSDALIPGLIRGNKNSKIYHLPYGCPSYESISNRNLVIFKDEEEAISAGFRIAKNCK